VLLPGSGSDHVFVSAAFAEPLGALGIRLLAPPPPAGPGLVPGLWRTLDSAAGPDVLVGGISFGAHLAARWASAHPGRCAGLLLAMPGWIGRPAHSPHGAATAAALAGAAAVRRDGTASTLAAVRATAPAPWVADELERAWNGYGHALADSLHAAALSPAPTVEELRRLGAPAGIAALSDDPLHPRAVATRWAEAMPRAAVVSTSLDAVGRDRAALGRAALLGWLRAAFLA